MSIGTAAPHAATELLDALAALALTDVGVALLHHGTRSVHLADALRARGARLDEIQIYESRLPRDLEPLRSLVRDLVAGRVDAVAFTSQIQVRHLFQVAAEAGQAPALERALREDTVVASVGPTCTAVLERFGVPPHVAPSHPKLHPLVSALMEYLDHSRSSAA